MCFYSSSLTLDQTPITYMGTVILDTSKTAATEMKIFFFNSWIVFPSTTVLEVPSVLMKGVSRYLCPHSVWTSHWCLVMRVYQYLRDLWIENDTFNALCVIPSRGRPIDRPIFGVLLWIGISRLCWKLGRLIYRRVCKQNVTLPCAASRLPFLWHNG